jgi:hypothetical protein
MNSGASGSNHAGAAAEAGDDNGGPRAGLWPVPTDAVTANGTAVAEAAAAADAGGGGGAAGDAAAAAVDHTPLEPKE